MTDHSSLQPEVRASIPGDLVARLEVLAESFRARADHRAQVLTYRNSAFSSAEIRDGAADKMAQFAETVAAILKSTTAPSVGMKSQSDVMHKETRQTGEG